MQDNRNYHSIMRLNLSTGIATISPFIGETFSEESTCRILCALNEKWSDHGFIYFVTKENLVKGENDGKGN